jgi:hypothetical protein
MDSAPLPFPVQAALLAPPPPQLRLLGKQVSRNKVRSALALAGLFQIKALLQKRCPATFQAQDVGAGFELAPIV